MSVNQFHELLESLKPLNFGRRFMFLKYLLHEISQNKIDEDVVEELKEDFLTDEFLYEDYIGSFEIKKDEFNQIFSNILSDDQTYERYFKEFQNKLLKYDERKKILKKSITDCCTNILFMFFAYKTMRIFF